MSRLRHFIQEIHRRSLWQVLGIYAVTSWVIYEVVQSLTEGLGLPQWFPAFAVVLLLIGLPIVVATAFVQEGIAPATRQDPTLLPGAEPGSEARPGEVGGARRLFTWRNAISGGVLALALWGVLATGWIVLYGRAAGSPSVDTKSVAVLPFVNMSANPENEYFSDGITETIITHLSKIADLKVISRTSVMQYKQTDKNLRQIADELGVTTILEGSVQRAEDRVQITAQLIDAESDDHLWAEQYNRQLSDIFAIQSEVALNISRALATALSAEEEQQIQRTPTENVEAFNLYLLGRHWVTRRTGFEKAVEYFERAIERDSTFALAYVGLADSYYLGVWYEGWGQAEAVPKARAAALKALEMDNALGEAYASLGNIELWMEWNWEEAKKNLERALALNPGYSEAHNWYGALLYYMGDQEMAFREIELALELDPMSPSMNATYGVALWQLGRRDEAIQQFQRALELAPDLLSGHSSLGSAYLEMGMYEEALEEFQPWSGYMTAAYSALGMTDSASIVLEEAKQKRLLDQVRAQVGMGRIDDAFEIMFQMVEQRDPLLLNVVGYNLYYSALYADPRFNVVLKKMGLPER